MEDEPADRQLAEPGQVAQLDLSKYRSRELVEHLVELISIPGSFLLIMLTTFVLMIAVVITVIIMFYNAHLFRVDVDHYLRLLAALRRCLGPAAGGSPRDLSRTGQYRRNSEDRVGDRSTSGSR